MHEITNGYHILYKNKCFAQMYCNQLNSRNMCPHIQMDESKCDLRTNTQWTAKNHDNEVKCTCGNRKKSWDLWGHVV